MSSDHQPPSSPANAGKPWLDSDLLFLRLALERGMSIAAVAGFLGRDEDEVRKKAKELGPKSRDEFVCPYDEGMSIDVMKKSLVTKRSIDVGGHKTSISLEDDFWRALKEIALKYRVTLSDLVGSIDSQRQHGNLSSAVRLFVLNHYRHRQQISAETDEAALHVGLFNDPTR
jgi:predicted DNA-binding ribbon-helix-helix protein